MTLTAKQIDETRAALTNAPAGKSRDRKAAIARLATALRDSAGLTADEARHAVTLIADEGATLPAALSAAQAPQAAPEPQQAPPKTREGTKQATLIAMMRRAEGATVAEVAEATGWQNHTIRGAIAGAIKKKLGLPVTAAKEEGRGTVYRLPA